MIPRNLRRSLAFSLVLVGARSVSATDYWDLASVPDNTAQSTGNELIHGASQQHDLQANPGPVGDQDWFLIFNYPRSSYEALIDATSADLQMWQDLGNLARMDYSGATVVQSAEYANVGTNGGYSVALRWQNTGPTLDRQYLRVQSTFCGVNCGAEDQYRIRYYDTTVSVPRFNNAAGQITVLIVQNSTGWTRNIAGTAYFWSSAGALLGSTTFSLAAKAALVLNTATVSGVAGQGGTITISHDGGYGNLAVKAVALEPATGFSFDSPGLFKPQ